MVNELVKLEEQPIGAPVDLKDFIASTLIQIVEGVAQSAEAVSKVGGAVNPAFQPSSSTERFGSTKDGLNTPVYAVSFDVAVVASSTDSLDAGAKLTVASVFSVGGKATTSERDEVTSRIKFMIPLLLPTDLKSNEATAEYKKQQKIESDRITNQINNASPYR